MQATHKPERDCQCLLFYACILLLPLSLTYLLLLCAIRVNRSCVLPTDLTDPQLTSLRTLVQSMTGWNDTRAYMALNYGYCIQQAGIVAVINSTITNWTNPLQVNCTNSYVTRVALTPTTTNPGDGPWAGNGILPPARSLGGLPQLNMLTCNGCGLDGTLPRDWGTSRNLMELRYLNLPGNTFTG